MMLILRSLLRITHKHDSIIVDTWKLNQLFLDIYRMTLWVKYRSKYVCC